MGFSDWFLGVLGNFASDAIRGVLRAEREQIELERCCRAAMVAAVAEQHSGAIVDHTADGLMDALWSTHSLNVPRVYDGLTLADRFSIAVSERFRTLNEIEVAPGVSQADDLRLDTRELANDFVDQFFWALNQATLRLESLRVLRDVLSTHRIEDRLDAIHARLDKPTHSIDLRVPPHSIVERYVDRSQSQPLVDALTSRIGGTVGVTTNVLRAPGGFGKTALAEWACNDARIRSHFPDGFVWVTLGRFQNSSTWGREADLAAKVMQTCRMIASHLHLSSTLEDFADPQAAGQLLGTLLADRRFLLIVDDVWSQRDLAPFLVGGANTTRLVTTRQMGVVPRIGNAKEISVDHMTSHEVASIIGYGLNVMPDDIAPLVKRAGSWALLAGLLGEALTLKVAESGDVVASVAEIEDAYVAGGPSTLTDLNDYDDRRKSIDVCMQISFEHLVSARGTEIIDRCDSLGLFPEDAEIPLEVLDTVWSCNRSITKDVCSVLFRSSLLRSYNIHAQTVMLHDEIRDYLRHRISVKRQQLQREMLDALRPISGLWSDLPDDHYLWDNLSYHLREAGSARELYDVATDGRWLATRLLRHGAAALLADIERASELSVHANVTASLERVVRQSSFLLSADMTRSDIASTLASRCFGETQLDDVRHSLECVAKGSPRASWPMPDRAQIGFFRAIRHEAWLHAVAWAPDNDMIATGGEDGVVRISSVATGAEVVPPIETDRIVYALDWSNDGTKLAVGTSSGVFVCTINDEVQIAGRLDHPARVRSLSWHSDGVRLATACNDGRTRLWNADDRSLIWTTRSLGWRIWDVEWVPHENQLSVLTANDVVFIFDSETGGISRTFAFGGIGARTLDWSANGRRLLLSGTEGNVQNCDVESGGLEASPRTAPSAVWTAAWRPDSACYAIVDLGGCITFFDGDRPRVLGMQLQHGDAVESIAWSGDGAFLASAGDDGVVRIWEPDRSLRARRPSKAKTTELDDPSAQLNDVAWNASGSLIACGRSDGRVVVRDAFTCEDIARHAHGAWVDCVAWSSDERLAAGGQSMTGAPGVSDMPLIVGSDIELRHGGLVTIWNNDGSANSFRMRQWVRSLSWSCDNTRLAVGGDSGLINIWDGDSWFELHNAHEPSLNTVRAVAWSPDDSLLAVGYATGVVELWKVQERQCVSRFSNPGWLVAHLMWHLNGRHLTSALSDGSIFTHAVIRRDNDVFLSTKSECVKPEFQHFASSPSGGYIATVGNDGAIRICDVSLEFETIAMVSVDGPLAGVQWGNGRIAAHGRRGLYVFEVDEDDLNTIDLRERIDIAERIPSSRHL